MNAQEARKLITEQDIENSEEVQAVYKAIAAHIAKEKPAAKAMVEFTYTTKKPLSGGAVEHLKNQGYTLEMWGGGFRDEGEYYTSIKF